MNRLSLAVALLLGALRLASAHARTDADKLLWPDPARCEFVYTDKDAFKGLKPAQCDFVVASRQKDRADFNAKARAAQQEATLYLWADDADKALKAFEKDKLALLEKTDPEKAPKSHEARAKKFIEGKAEIEREAPKLAEPFGGKESYLKELRARAADLAKREEEEKKQLDESQKARVEAFKGKLEAPGPGSLAGVKKGAALGEKGGGATFDGSKPGAKDGSAGHGETGRLAAAAPAGGQLRDSAAGAAEGQFGKPVKPPPPPETMGKANEQQSKLDRGLEYVSNKMSDVPGFRTSPAASARSLGALEANIVADPKVSKAATKEADRVLTQMLKDSPPEVADNMVKNGVHVVIIPKGEKLTDVGDFQQLRGQKTFDGRSWDDVRGVADVPMKGGGVACAVPEENLTSRGKSVDSSGYPPDYTMSHEFGHMVKFYGVPKEEGIVGQTKDAIGLSDHATHTPTTADIEAQYQAVASKSGKRDEDSYAYSNADEFWAQRTTMWFGTDQYGKTPKDFCPKEQKTCDMLQNVYGNPKNLA